MLENHTSENRRFAVIDLEASSTKPRNRIIEVAALILEDDGQTVVLKDSYSTLVNPEVEVPKDILDLTGITTEELETAPKFFEIAEDLELLTRDCTVVAHNVNFDISLLKEEYEKLGTEYLRKTKCTQQLAKEHYPELASYDLKSLCQLLEIDLDFNHRAMDDAIAAAELFRKTYIDSLPGKREEGPSITKIHKIHPGLNLCFFGDLNEGPGVVHFNADEKTIYIERFENLKVEVPRFLTKFHERFETEVEEVQILSFKDTLMAMRKKEERINQLQPQYNMEERRTSWGVFLKENPFSLKAFPLDKGKGDLLFISNNKEDAIHWIRIQLDDVEKQEFAYIDQQDKRLLNRLKKEREKTIRAKVKHFATYPHDYFVVMGPGKDDDELSCHFFTGGKLKGHAYLSGQAVYSLDSVPKDLKPLRETELLKHYFLREFHDWKTRASRDHSIKVLKSDKQLRSSADSNGNQAQDSSQRGHYKKKKKNNRHGSKKNHSNKNSPNRNSKKKKYSKKPNRNHNNKKAKPTPA
ncbi:MAG: 3'-5' exonuclease [Halobacteriovoraceae bacterium]|nr:3'-5' exonuclease [Halobacteriovoraceae bacterium]